MQQNCKSDHVPWCGACRQYYDYRSANYYRKTKPCNKCFALKPPGFCYLGRKLFCILHHLTKQAIAHLFVAGIHYTYRGYLIRV